MAAGYEATLQVSGSVRLIGDGIVQLESPYLRGASISFSGPVEGSIEIRESRQVVYERKPGSPLGPYDAVSGLPHVTLETIDLHGGLAFSPSSGAFVIIEPKTPLRFEIHGIETYAPAALQTREPDTLVPESGGRRIGIPQGTGLGSLQSNSTIAGPATIILHGGVLFLDDDTYPLEVSATATPEDPYTLSSTREEARRYAVVQLTSGTATMGGLWQTWVTSLHATIQGSATFIDVTANSDFGDAQITSDLGLIEAIGNLTIEGGWTSQDSNWRIVGEAAYVRADQSWWNDKTRVVAIGAGIGALGLLIAIVWKALPWILATRARPLDGPRAAMLELITINPGMTRREVGAALGLTRTNVTYHLTVLRRHHQIEIHTQHGREHILPNGGSIPQTMTIGATTIPARPILAAQRNPIRKQIIGLLERHGAVTASELLDAWTGPRPSRTLLSYHLHVLHEQGLLEIKTSTIRVEWSLQSAA